MFANMRAKTKWNIDGPFLLGYFFLDPSEGNLKKAATELQSSGYRIVGVHQVSEEKLFLLYVERVEVHTPCHWIPETKSSMHWPRSTALPRTRA